MVMMRRSGLTHTVIQNPHLEGGSFFWQGNAVGVLLIHGFTATTAEVRPLARVLYAQGYTVAGPLLPGHGTTPEEMNRCRWRDWADAAEAAYQEISTRCQRVVVGGESMGGLLSLYLASEHPEITGVLTYAPALKVISRVTPLLAPILAPFVSAYSKSPGEPSPADERWQGYTVYPARAVGQLFRLQHRVRQRLPRIHQPLLVVQGRLDTTVAQIVPEVLGRDGSSAVKEVHRLDQSGHCVILDREWEQVAEWTLRFIQRVLVDAPERS